MRRADRAVRTGVALLCEIKRVIAFRADLRGSLRDAGRILRKAIACSSLLIFERHGSRSSVIVARPFEKSRVKFSQPFENPSRSTMFSCPVRRVLESV